MYIFGDSECLYLLGWMVHLQKLPQGLTINCGSKGVLSGSIVTAPIFEARVMYLIILYSLVVVLFIQR